MRKTKLLLALALYALGMSAQQLQTPNLKFGKPTEEELTMTTYDRDTTAAAVVLCQLTDVRYSVMAGGGLSQTTFVRTRIKILKPEGKKYADISVKYYDSGNSQQAHENIEGLKVQTFNMENGKVKKTSLPGKMMFEKDLGGNHHSIDCSAADVKVGSVIEYSYNKWSNMWYSLDDYYAQASIPVAYCNYTADVPSMFKLSVQYTSVGDFVGSQSAGTLNIAGAFHMTNPNIETTIYKATGHFLPAIKDNDFLYCPRDYSAHVSNELQAIQIPGEMTKSLSQTWEDVDKNILYNSTFGKYLNDHSKLRDEIAASGIDKISGLKEKVAALYELMLKHVKWNGKYRLFPDEKNDPLKTGSGSNADLNMLFISMLNDLGIDNNACIMSSRSNGELSPIFANLEHLNTFIVSVSDSTNTYFIDSSVKDGYVDVLPSELYTDRARIIGKKIQSQWVNLQAIAQAQTTISENVKIDNQGLATTTCKVRYKGNASASRKDDYHEAKDSTTWVNDIANDHGITIEKYEIKGPEEFSPECDEAITYTRQLDTTDSLIYVLPFAMKQTDSNPFAADKRDMPFEFPYMAKTTYVANIQIPDGYKPEELPHSQRATTKDGSLTTLVNFKYNTTLNSLQVMMRYNVNKMFFQKDEFPDMKAIFDNLVELTNTTIALKKL